jgi:hypothetical protein
MSKYKNKGKLPPFVPMTRTTVQTPAWKAMTFGARSLYHDLRSFLRFDNLNNGKVYRSHRDAARDLGTSSTRSVGIWFRELQHYGFIVKTTEGCLGVDGEGTSPHWRLTECPSFDAKGTHIAPTRDFEKWDGVLFERKTESRVTKGLAPSHKGNHTGNPKRDEKCPTRVTKGLIVLPWYESQRES